MVFYFTATGNSLHVARQIGGELCSIARELRCDRRRYRAEAIGVVNPVFYHELPAPVKEFLSISEFACDYFFVVGTYGNRHGGFAELTRRFLEECGRPADYINTVIMVDNALPGYDIAEQLRIDPAKRVDAQIAAVRADIDARRRFVQPATEGDLAHHASVVEKGRIAPTEADPLYAVDDRCTSCGTCARVCPTGCIELVGGRPRYAYARCAVCMACIHACPVKAIRFAAITEKNPQARYRNPHVTLDDLFAANGNDRTWEGRDAQAPHPDYI